MLIFQITKATLSNYKIASSVRRQQSLPGSRQTVLGLWLLFNTILIARLFLFCLKPQQQYLFKLYDVSHPWTRLTTCQLETKVKDTHSCHSGQTSPVASLYQVVATDDMLTDEDGTYRNVTSRCSDHRLRMLSHDL